jgi:hypothetical protein
MQHHVFRLFLIQLEHEIRREQAGVLFDLYIQELVRVAYNSATYRKALLYAPGSIDLFFPTFPFLLPEHIFLDLSC